MSNLKSRSEHLQFCKDRALQYLNQGNGSEAIASMLSDLGKHKGTCDSVQIGAMLMMATDPNDAAAVRRFIEGFN